MPEKEIIYKGRRIVKKPGKLEHHLYIDGEHVRVFQPTPNGSIFRHTSIRVTPHLTI